MSGRIKLSGVLRDFLGRVSKAAFSNPFSLEYEKIIRDIADSRNDAGDKLKKKATSCVRENVDKLKLKGIVDFRHYTGKDKELVRISLLYDTYRHFDTYFDQLILTQIEAGDEPCHVPFAKEALSLLRGRGFNQDESRHYVAFFYQLRRAFYFINNSLSGQSRSMNTLRAHLWNNIFTFDPRWYELYLWDRMEDFSTFLIGETGSGKGTAAAAIGRSGFIPYDIKKEQFAESFTSNFIEINLSQYPESLIESELFGHKRGAFTGAVDNYQGVFARCKPHGAIFLDEIGDVSVPIQIKLLKVLQERFFSVVGSHNKERFNGRIIAATNKPIVELRKSDTFRDDFYYRLCSDVISVPPLRTQIKEHRATLSDLLTHVVQRIIGGPSPELVNTTMEIIQQNTAVDYNWPGNVRELEQAVRRIIITRHYSGDVKISASNLKNKLYEGIDEGTINAQNLLASYCQILYESHGTYEEVSRITQLDRRTVKKHIQTASQCMPAGSDSSS